MTDDENRQGLEYAKRDIISAIFRAMIRLQEVDIRKTNDLDILQEFDHHDTLFYLDPPYTEDSRTSIGEYGVHDTQESLHEQLAEVANKSRAKIAISGYDNALYEKLFPSPKWRREVNTTGIGDKRQEVLWMNY